MPPLDFLRVQGLGFVLMGFIRVLRGRLAHGILAFFKWIETQRTGNWCIELFHLLNG